MSDSTTSASWMDMADHLKTIDRKSQKLKNILRSMGRVMVAFSGGVDSSLLLKIAKDVLQENVIAVTALSETTSAEERDTAIRLAKLFEVRHLMIESHDLDFPEFVKNFPDKCYVCKKNRFAALLELSRREGMDYVIDGENVDDQKDYRPGIRATRELGIRSPLSEAGLTKEEIRQLSKQLGLPVWDKPSAACLASRIPYYQEITAEKLKQVEDGEVFLRKQGFQLQIRVRHEGDTARIELAQEEIPKMLESDVRRRVLAFFNKLGFKHVAVDLKGYQMGSLNKSLPSSVKKPLPDSGRSDT